MATAVASRFAVLSLDDDDAYIKKKKKQQQQPPKPTNGTTTKPDPTRKKKPTPQTQPSKTSKKKKKEVSDPKQWEEWQQKDTQIVAGTFEEDLTQAILLSKLDYEQNKPTYDAAKKNAEDESKKGNKKNKKMIKVLTVEEFHNLGKPNSREDSPSVSSNDTQVKDDPEFFVKVKEDVKKELEREGKLEKVKKRTRDIETFNEDALAVAQYKDALERKQLENEELRDEIDKLKEELKNVKTRNKTLYQILANGEMKDKAQVLMELERLQSVKDELSAEVISLHTQLEQERSKVRALTDKGKDKNKKRTVSSSENHQ